MVLLLACPLSAPRAWAEWAALGNQAVIAANNQVNAQAISDGSGGMIVVWQDFRTGVADIYAQRFDASGNRLWGDGGVAICTATDHQESPVLCSDGAGGAVIAWQDRRTGTDYDIYAQGVTPAGALKWLPSTGVAICTATGNQTLEVIATDGAGGAIIAWRDARVITNTDIYARRISSGGTPLWVADGVPVCTETGQQNDLRILPDGVGGAFLAWRDPRNGSFNNDIYAQSLDPDGNARWTANGIAVVSSAFDQLEPTISSDGAFGLLVTWQDARNGTDYDIFAQRVKPDGTPRWTPNGIQVCDVDSSQSKPLVVSDGLRGAIVAWTDGRTSSKWPDIYAQKLDSTGVAAWAANGVTVTTADSGQFLKTMIPDQLGGAILGWDDERGAGNDEDLYTQAISTAGALRWGSGILIGTGTGTRRLTTSAPDGYGGALYAWEDFRGGSTSDIYGLRLTSLGTGVEVAPAPPARAPRLTSQPNPFNPHTSIRFTLDAPSHFTLAIYDVRGRLVRELGRGTASAGPHVFAWDGTTEEGTPCASGGYTALLTLPSGLRALPIRLVR